MLVLLPPSEGKAQAASGPPVDLPGLSLPGLTAARETVLAELVALCSSDPDKAREVLGLGERLRDEVTRNAALLTAPARPAGEIYTGVLYDALGLATLSPEGRERAGRSLLVFSALWGAVRVTDPIPAYRLSGGTKLPGIGPLGAFWRPALGEVMPGAVREAAGSGDGGLVLDLRSTAYAGMWKPAGEVASRIATVRVLHSRTVDGVERRSVVSHFNKATKGRLVRDLLEAGTRPGTPEELAEELRALGYRVEEGPERPGRARQLDVVVSEL
ncbi:peroxide stress protein YaaA [Streptomyces sodiiphilus]|uniref:Peroxide stress protein YaaA n=1 Tax=Streptomyces sodiiphilus TaxID=226217 RepID=A0ABN2NST6_9ACTN